MRAHSDIRKASGFVITTEPLGFVLTKEVNVFLLRVNVTDLRDGAKSSMSKKSEIIDSGGGGRDPSSYFNHCFIDIDFVDSALYQNYILDFQSRDKACKSISFRTHINFVMGYHYNERLNSMSPGFPF